MKKIILLLAVLSLVGCGVTREQLATTAPLNEIVVQANKDELIKCTAYRMRDKWKSTSLLGIMGSNEVNNNSHYVISDADSEGRPHHQ